MSYLDKNVPCVVTIMTTGLRPIADDIIALCILPIKHEIPFLGMGIQPNKGGYDLAYIGARKKVYYNILKTGSDVDLCYDAIINWKEKYVGDAEHLIDPHVWDWFYVKSFLQSFLGEATFDYVFSKRVRDILPISQYLNDRAQVIGERLPHMDCDSKSTVIKHGLTCASDVNIEALAIKNYYRETLSRFGG